MPATAHRALPLPAGTDIPDVPAWLSDLADALDFDLFVVATMPRPAFGTLGRVHRDPGTGVLSFDTGAAWETLTRGGPYLLLGGGTMTGALDVGGQILDRALIRKASLAVVTDAAAGGALTMDAAVAHIFDWTPAANITSIALANLPTEWDARVVIHMGVTLRSIVWPASAKWAGGIAPTLSTNQRSEFSFSTLNGGTILDAVVVGQGFA